MFYLQSFFAYLITNYDPNLIKSINIFVYLLRMFFGGGFPFGFGHHPSQQEEEQNQEQSLYDLLGLSEDASPEQIKEKHIQLAEKFRPGGQQQDADQFQQINEAFEILSNPQQRKLYDQQRKQQNQLFQMMHGGKSNKNQSNQLPKMQPTKRGISVSLQKLYTGGTMPLYHQRARKCDVCEGKGGKDVKQCTQCKGKGAVAKMVQVGPGMFTRMAQNCKECEGKGDIFGEGGKCQTCEGQRIVKKNVDLEVPIPAGAPPGHVITLEGDGNQVRNSRPGDLILVVQQQPNEHFTRKGADLFYKKSISLIESLLGFNFILTHLDGKQYTIYTRPGEIVGDTDKKIVKNLGMPFFGTEEEHGNLVIQFKVVMPKRGELNPEQIKALSSVLPGKINERPIDTNYEMLQDYEREHVNSNEEGGRKEDDEQEGQQGGIGCQAQ